MVTSAALPSKAESARWMDDAKKRDRNWSGHRFRDWHDSEDGTYSVCECNRCKRIYFVRVCAEGTLFGPIDGGMGGCPNAPETLRFAALVKRNGKAAQS